MRKEFYNSFETKIVPKIKPFEAERKKTRALASMVSVGLVLIGIILLLAPLFEPLHQMIIIQIFQRCVYY